MSFFKSSPNYAFLKVFGCACYPFLRPYNNHKLQFRTSKCLFLGYSPAHKGYRCLHPSGRLYIAKTVHFHECDFPYDSLFKSVTSHNSSNINIPTSILVNDSLFTNNMSHLTSSLPTQSTSFNDITTESSQLANHNNTNDSEPTSQPHFNPDHNDINDPEPTPQS